MSTPRYGPLKPTIPERTVGGYSIKHEHAPAGKIFNLYSTRTAFFSNGRRTLRSVKFDVPTIWHSLVSKEHGTWMSDFPIEQFQMYSQSYILRSPSPRPRRILIGGLGLGVIVQQLLSVRGTENITIVERSKEVIELVGESVEYATRKKRSTIKVELVNDDLFEYLKGLDKNAFTHAFYDIWQGDNEDTFFGIVVPLWTLSAEKVRIVPLMWNEDIMRGQLRFSIATRFISTLTNNISGHGTSRSLLEQWERTFEELKTSKDLIFWDWQIPFWNTLYNLWLADMQPLNPKWFGSRGIMGLHEYYASHYGYPRFEKMWQSIQENAR